jgi:SPRY domain-containing SOCS box protein 3
MMYLKWKPENENTNCYAKKRQQHPYLAGKKLKTSWTWDPSAGGRSECISLSEDKMTAYFYDNPYTISRGTAAVRGTESAARAGIHYFEVLIREPLYGTAVMIGYGTDEVKLHYDNFDYVNLVGGADAVSWGLSHKGLVWHDGKSRRYCEPFFDKETRVGVLLNTHDKTLHYFINGNYLGVAFEYVYIYLNSIFFNFQFKTELFEMIKKRESG